MGWYILGTTMGGMILTAGLFLIFWFFLKNRGLKKKIQEIGQRAEDRINADIKIWAKKTKNYFVGAHLYRYQKNKVFEVDSILLTNRALIVVEIKSIKGTIVGDAQQLRWKKVLGNEEFFITNSIVQNERHIEHLMKMTNITVPTISLIVYSNRSEKIDIKNIPSHAIITRHNDLFNVLDEIEDSLPIKISEYDLKTILANIKKYRTNRGEDIHLFKAITKRTM